MNRPLVPCLLLAAILVGAACASAAEPAAPIVPGPEGQRAWDDLEHLYAQDRKPPYAAALGELAGADEAAGTRAGRYLHALLAQSLADEENGRAEWRSLPFWGGGAESAAREFRKELAAAFAQRAAGPAALPAAAWLLDEERLADGQQAGAVALRRIRTPAADDLLRTHIRRLHPNGQVAVALIEEAAARGLKDLAPDVLALRNHHRQAVRDAARAAAPALGSTEALGDFDPAAAFTPALVGQLEQLAAMQLVAVPAAARWMAVTHTEPGLDGKPVTTEHHGWLLDDAGETWHLLDWFGCEARLAKRQATAVEGTLAAEAERIAAARKSDEARKTLSREGGLTGQFEPGFLSVPELLVGLWSWQRGDLATAAAVLFPCFDAAADDRWVVWAARDLFGHPFHQRMLEVFSRDRDYPAAVRLAEHLSQPAFDGYQYQDRARELARQLKGRGEDFTTLVLPPAAAWKAMRENLSRRQQVEFLARRLRLLNCFQWSQPGDVSYQDPQYAPPLAGQPDWDDEAAAARVEVINPYVELGALKLSVRELPFLIPWLRDDNFMPTYSYWRSFHPTRTLHRVNWAVASLVNAVARRDLADLRRFDRLDAAGREQAIAEMLEWCRAHESMSPEQLILETLRTADDYGEFSQAADEGVAARHESILDPLLARFARHDELNKEQDRKPKDPDVVDFGGRGPPDWRDDIARWAFELDTPKAADPARRWLGHPDEDVRFHAALILLRHGDRTQLEGLDQLEAILARRNSTESYARALGVLLATGDERALKVACRALENEEIDLTFGGDTIVRRLFLAGRAEARDFLVAALDATTTDDDPFSGSRADEVAELLADWRRDEFEFNRDAPAAERAQKRAELKQWLARQFDLIHAGKPPEIPADAGDPPTGGWRIDAP